MYPFCVGGWNRLLVINWRNSELIVVIKQNKVKQMTGLPSGPAGWKHMHLPTAKHTIYLPLQRCSGTIGGTWCLFGHVCLSRSWTRGIFSYSIAMLELSKRLCAVTCVCALYVYILFAYVAVETLIQRLRSSLQLQRINTVIKGCCAGSKCAMMHDGDVDCTHLIITHTYPDAHSHVWKVISTPNCTQCRADFYTETLSRAVLFLKAVNRWLNLASSFRRVL